MAGPAAYHGHMTNLPFGFGPSDPDEHGENTPFGQGGENPFGGQGGEFDFGQLGQMLSQLGQMLSQTTSSSGPVNYDLAKQIAVQRLAGVSPAGSEQKTAVSDAVRLAEMWLDPVTTLPTGANR